MPETYGFTHAVISKSTDPEDPFVFHIHALRAGQPDGEQVLIATVDDERPMLATRILRMLEDRGITIEGPPLEINPGEPDIYFIGVRGAIDGNDREWSDLEVRFMNGEKTAAASFPEEYEAFAFAIAEMFPRP